MKKWRYNIVHVSIAFDTETLNQYGEEGWELIYIEISEIYSYWYYFKKEIE